MESPGGNWNKGRGARSIHTKEEEGEPPTTRVDRGVRKRTKQGELGAKSETDTPEVGAYSRTTS